MIGRTTKPDDSANKKLFINNNNALPPRDSTSSTKQRGLTRISKSTTTSSQMARTKQENTDNAQQPAPIRRSSRLGGVDATQLEKEKNGQTRKRKRAPVKEKRLEEPGDPTEEGSSSTRKRRRKSVDATENSSAVQPSRRTRNDATTAAPSTSTPLTETSPAQQPRQRPSRRRLEAPTQDSNDSLPVPLPSESIPETADHPVASSSRLLEAEQSLPMASSSEGQMDAVCPMVGPGRLEEESGVEKNAEDEAVLTAKVTPPSHPAPADNEAASPTPTTAPDTTPALIPAHPQPQPPTRPTRSSGRTKTTAPPQPSTTSSSPNSTRHHLTRSTHVTSTVVAASTGGAPAPSLEGGRALRARAKPSVAPVPAKRKKTAKEVNKAKANAKPTETDEEGEEGEEKKSKGKEKVVEVETEVPSEAVKKPKPTLTISTTVSQPPSAAAAAAADLSPLSPVSPLSPLSPVDASNDGPVPAPAQAPVTVTVTPETETPIPIKQPIILPQTQTHADAGAEAGPGPNTLAMRSSSNNTTNTSSSSSSSLTLPLDGPANNKFPLPKRETRSATSTAKASVPASAVPKTSSSREKAKARDGAGPYPVTSTSSKTTRGRVTRSSMKAETETGEAAHHVKGKGKDKAKEGTSNGKGKRKSKAEDVHDDDDVVSRGRAGDAIAVVSATNTDLNPESSSHSIPPQTAPTPTPTPKSPSPEVVYIRRRIRSVKTKGFDGNWDGREIERQRKLKEREEKSMAPGMKSEAVETSLGEPVIESGTTATVEEGYSSSCTSGYTVPVPVLSRSRSCGYSTAGGEEVRRSSRTRTKSARLVMSEMGELQTSVVKNGNGNSRQTKPKVVKEKTKGNGKGKGKGKEAEKVSAEKETNVAGSSQTDADPRQELVQPPAAVAVVVAATAPAGSDSTAPRGRSRDRAPSGLTARSRSPSRSRSQRRSRSRSPSTSRLSSSPSTPHEPPPPPNVPVASFAFQIGALDTSTLDRIDGLESAERVATPETVRSFTPMPTSSSIPAARNIVLVDAAPNAALPVGSVLTSHGEANQTSSVSSSGDERIEDDMPRPGTDAVLGASSPTLQTTPPSSPPSPALASTSSPAQATTGAEPTQQVQDPIFASSGADGFPWTGSGFQGNVSDYPPPSPSTIAPNSPYIGPFPPNTTNDQDDHSDLNMQFLPPAVDPSNYSILVNRLVVSIHDPQVNPRGVNPQGARSYHFSRPLSKPPCTSPPFTDPREIARPDLSSYPPYKWLASFDPEFRDKGRGEHQYPQYPHCDFSSSSFASPASRSGVQVGTVFRGPSRRTTSVDGGRNVRWAWEKALMQEVPKKPSLVAMADLENPSDMEELLGHLPENRDGEASASASAVAVGAVTDGDDDDDDEAMEEVVIESQASTAKKTTEERHFLRENAARRPRSSTSPYVRELFESGVAQLMFTENVRWKTIRAVCEAEANEYWAKHGVPRAWRVSPAGAWKKRELLHRGIIFPNNANQGFTHLPDAESENADEMDYQNEPTYHWELASDEDEEEVDEEMPSSDLDASSETAAEEQRVETNLLESDSEDEDEDEDGEDGDVDESPVQGEMQLDIQAPVEKWNAPAEATPQPTSISPASTLLSSSSFHPSSSSLADALTPPASHSPVPTPAQLMEPSRPTNPPSPGGMTYDFAYSKSADGAIATPVPHVSSGGNSGHPMVIGTGRDGVLQLPAPPLSRYFAVKQFDDSLNPFMFDPDRTSREFAERSQKQMQFLSDNNTPLASQQDETPVSPVPFDYFSHSASSSTTSVTSAIVEEPALANKVMSSTPSRASHRRAWMHNPTRRMFPYYSERLGHISMGTAPDPNRLRQWALCAEEAEKREKDRRVQQAEAEDKSDQRDNEGDSGDRGRHGKKKAKAKTTKGKSKGKGKAVDTEDASKQDEPAAEYDEEASLLRAVEISVAERTGQADGLPPIGSSSWYEQRYQTDQMFPQGRMSDLPQWREMFKQAKAANEAQNPYGMYYQASEFQQGSSRDGYAEQSEYYQQLNAGNLYSAQDHHQLEFSQDGSAHISDANTSQPTTTEDHEMTDEDADGDADPDVLAPSQGYWPFLGGFGGNSSGVSTATPASSNESAPSGSSTTSTSVPSIDVNIDPILHQQSSNSQLYPSMQQPPSATGAETSLQNQGQHQNRLQHVNTASGGGDVIGMLNMGVSVGHQAVVNMSGINVSNLSGMGLGVMGMNMGVGMGIEVGFGLVGGIMGGFGMSQNMDVPGLDVESWYLPNAGSSSAAILTETSDGQRSPPQPSVQPQSCSRSSSPASSPIGMGMDVDPPSPGEQRLGSRSPSERESPHPLGFAMG
ncbi:hypothetical protein D9758_015936 [Tetrapyrgos nigripes]|uniref:Uncharacterized protein n=1 Tax=Tetrapyrgos nigripes TaxID=182062 RepID=A0A8H5FH67_9AGAR|nr:hypothetical protein D9758_015936 [Tetrapyrgos nigripes]